MLRESQQSSPRKETIKEKKFTLTGKAVVAGPRIVDDDNHKNHQSYDIDVGAINYGNDMRDV